jgi:hypothetical protein
MYTLEVEREGSTPDFTLEISAAEARNTVQLLVPAARLAPGQYAVVISGTQGTQGSGNGRTEITRSHFALEFGK